MLYAISAEEIDEECLINWRTGAKMILYVGRRNGQREPISLGPHSPQVGYRERFRERRIGRRTRGREEGEAGEVGLDEVCERRGEMTAAGIPAYP